MKKIKLNIVAESFIGQANGVYTAFVEAVDALKKQAVLDLTINGDCRSADVVHSHTIGIKYVWLSFFYKDKMIVSAHVVPDSFIGSLILSEVWRPLAKLYLYFVYNRARMVIAVSPQVKYELLKLGIKSDVQVLCNSVDRKKFAPDETIKKSFRHRLGIDPNRFVAVTVGQIQPRKGIYDFLAVAKRCPDITFVWVGGRPYGRLTADFNALTEAVNTAPKNVIFTGIVSFEEMPKYYAMADVYFLPSLQENFAFATVEAASVKLPLVLRDNPEYPDSLFMHYLKGKSVEEYAAIFNKLSTDANFLKQWQTESDRLAARYEITAYTQQLIQYYQKIAG